MFAVIVFIFPKIGDSPNLSLLNSSDLPSCNKAISEGTWFPDKQHAYFYHLVVHSLFVCNLTIFRELIPNNNHTPFTLVYALNVGKRSVQQITYTLQLGRGVCKLFIRKNYCWLSVLKIPAQRQFRGGLIYPHLFRSKSRFGNKLFI